MPFTIKLWSLLLWPGPHKHQILHDPTDPRYICPALWFLHRPQNLTCFRFCLLISSNWGAEPSFRPKRCLFWNLQRLILPVNHGRICINIWKTLKQWFLFQSNISCLTIQSYQTPKNSWFHPTSYAGTSLNQPAGVDDHPAEEKNITNTEIYCWFCLRLANSNKDQNCICRSKKKRVNIPLTMMLDSFLYCSFFFFLPYNQEVFSAGWQLHMHCFRVHICPQSL